MRPDADTSNAKALRNKYAVVGVGETSYVRGSGRTTRALGADAVRKAISDAGLEPSDIDGMLSYQFNDAAFSTAVASDLGIRLDFYMDVIGGGASIEALIGIAIGVIEAGLCKSIAIFRAMNGYSEIRMGGTGSRSAIPVAGDMMHSRPYGWYSPAQRFSASFIRHMHDHGTKPDQVAMVRVIHSEHASNNPKALYRKRVSVADVLNSRLICAPIRLLDCCVESDNGAAVVVTSVERAKDCRHAPVLISGVVGRCCKPRADMHFQNGPVSMAAGHFARDILWRNAGIGPQEIDVTGAYDAFTFTTLMQLEAFGFCQPGEGGSYVSDGTIRLGGRRPNNTSGGQLCEGYTHGVNLVIENVRQLRHDVDDTCPIGPDGRKQHSYNYSEGCCRQVKQVDVTANLGWAGPETASAMVMCRG